MINASLSTIIYLISISSQTYVKICFTFDSYLLYLALFLYYISLLQLNVIYKSTCLENYIPVVMPPLNPISLPFMAATFLTTCLMAVLQPSRYSIFHGRDTPIQLSLPWRSWSCQCLNTETSARGNRGCYTEIPSISYTTTLYIRLVVTL